MRGASSCRSRRPSSGSGRTWDTEHRVKGVALVLLVLATAFPALALAGPKDPTKRHTAADMRLARSIALTRADLAAGWTQEQRPGSSGDAQCSAMPDESKLIETGEVDPVF